MLGALLNTQAVLALDTVEPGSLTIAFGGDMPGTDYQDGKMVGYDGEILQQISKKLALKVKPALMDWSGTIAPVQAKRVDIMAGTMGWTDQRAKIMTLIDPIHYFKNGITQADKTQWHSLKELEGKKVGTIIGFSFIAELRNLIAGRVDAVIGDPPVMQYAIFRNPQ